MRLNTGALFTRCPRKQRQTGPNADKRDLINPDRGQQATEAVAGNRHGATTSERWICRPDSGACTSVITRMRTRWRRWMRRPHCGVGLNAWTAVAIVHDPWGLDVAGAPSAKSPRGIIGERNAGEICYLWRILHEKVLTLCNDMNSGHIKTFILLLWIHRKWIGKILLLKNVILYTDMYISNVENDQFVYMYVCTQIYKPIFFNNRSLPIHFDDFILTLFIYKWFQWPILWC